MGNPILDSLKDVLAELGVGAHTHAEIRDGGLRLSVGPVLPTDVPFALERLSDLVSKHGVSSLHVVRKGRES